MTLTAPLQWGRVLWDAERRIGSNSYTGAPAASMGPRLVGRGKHIRAQRRTAGRRASMGPRLVGRGK